VTSAATAAEAPTPAAPATTAAAPSVVAAPTAAAAPVAAVPAVAVVAANSDDGAATGVDGPLVPAKSPADADSSHPAAPVEVQERPVSALPAVSPKPAPRVRPKPAPVQPAVAVAAAAPAPPAPETPSAPLADGSLTLGITPWGEIIVDGKSHGVSPPLTHLTLAPGVHTVEVRNGSAPPFVSRIELQPGQAVEVQHRF